MAPEQITDERVTNRVDIYALTGVLFHCLTGRVPFEHESDPATLWAHLNAPRPSALALSPELPAEIDRVIARGMAIDPADRYATAGGLAHEAAAVLGVQMLDDHPPGT
jgi:serine/threonine-protein kinase